MPEMAPEAFQIHRSGPPRVQRLHVLANRHIALVFDVLEHLLRLPASVQVENLKVQRVLDGVLHGVEAETGKELDGLGRYHVSVWSHGWLDKCLLVSHLACVFELVT